MLLDRVVLGGLQTLPVQPASQGEPLSSTGPALAWCLLVEELAVKREPLLDQVGRLVSLLLSQAVVRLTEQAAVVEELVRRVRRALLHPDPVVMGVQARRATS